MTEPRTFNVNGKKLTVKEIALKFNIRYKTLSERLRKGKTIYEAVKPIVRENNNPVNSMLSHQLDEVFTWDLSNEIGY